MLRAANARLREVIEAKETEVTAPRTSHQAQLDALRAQVAAPSAQVAELHARLGQNPRNSSKPPSSEGLAKPAPRSLRRKSGRKPGRPKGQPGATLEMTSRPDEVVTHEPGRCSPGIWWTWARESCSSGSSFSAWAAACCAARPRPNRPTRHCRCLAFAWPR